MGEADVILRQDVGEDRRERAPEWRGYVWVRQMWSYARMARLRMGEADVIVRQDVGEDRRERARMARLRMGEADVIVRQDVGEDRRERAPGWRGYECSLYILHSVDVDTPPLVLQ